MSAPSDPGTAARRSLGAMSRPGSYFRGRPCDVCGGEYFLGCRDRHVAVCAACLIYPGRLGALDHWMPGGLVICAHRRTDSLALEFGAGPTVLYQTGGDPG
jgi:hypothetical protein